MVFKALGKTALVRLAVMLIPLLGTLPVLAKKVVSVTSNQAARLSTHPHTFYKAKPMPVADAEKPLREIAVTDDTKKPMALFPKPSLNIVGKVSVLAVMDDLKHRHDSLDKFTLASKGNLTFRLGSEPKPGKHIDSSYCYGAVASLDLTRNKTGSPDFLKAMYLYLGSEKGGMIQLGELEGAQDQLMMSGADLLGATGGFNGSMWIVATPTSGTLVSNKTSTYSKYATKAVYRSPLVGGFQFMISYNPGSVLLGSRRRVYDGNGSDYFKIIDKGGTNTPLKKVTELALTYGFDVNDTEINLYLAGGVAAPDPTKNQRQSIAGAKIKAVKNWRVGALVDFGDLRIAAGYFNNNRSLVRSDHAHETAGQAYNGAISYRYGQHLWAIGYMGSERKVEGGKARADISSVTYEYALTKGVTLFLEGNYYQTKTPKAYKARVRSIKNFSAEKGGSLQDDNQFLYGTDLLANQKGFVALTGLTVRF